MNNRQLILIVDDEKINRRILTKLLSDEYDCIEAANGAEALDILKEKGNEIDAIMLDIIMPVMDGYEFLGRIKQLSMTELPIIAMTSETDVASEEKALDAGAWDFVNKPYEPRIISIRLKNAIARRQVSVFMKMRKMAAHDSLTGLHNRERTFAKTRELIDSNPEITFLFLRADVDRFALYNSAFGEEAGDKLLCFIASIFSEIAVKYPLITYGRVSGDVFCACVPYSGKTDAVIREVDKIQSRLNEYRTDYRIEISVGAYIVEDRLLSVEECLQRAAIGSQKCKNKYGKSVGFYDEEYTKKLARQVSIENEMRKALEEEQFVVYLQPKIQLSTDSICGAEALVRWQHPEKGLIPPGEFIPVFESNGFIADLDFYVWEHTCMILKNWIEVEKNVFPVSVNISRISLYNPNIIQLLQGLIARYELDVNLLQLEITESAYMTNQNLMKKTISELQKAGFTILMDDFGSGYSSLNTLKDIEVDILKLDMKFLSQQESIGKGEIILASMIKMANWIGMQVVVEGVETLQQRNFLEGADCNYVQGYFYSKPLPIDEFENKYIDSQLEEDIVEPSKNKKARKDTILIIDDAETDRDIISFYFKNRFDVHQCVSVEDALVYLKYNHMNVRLMLVDNIMKGMSGLEFLNYCKDEPTLALIPKIMITASDETEDHVKAFRCGAYDFITKPLNMEILDARISHVLESRRSSYELQSWELNYRNLAERDRATGLLNKIAFTEMANHILENEENDLMALLVIDFDNFKNINDVYGHLLGDKVLKCFADVLTKEFRKTDVVSRFGGDEFTVFMTSIPSMEIARRKADDIMKSISAAIARELKVEAGISIGIAFSEVDDNIDSIFARADEALYEAKNTGRGRVVIFGETVPPVIDDDKSIILICGDDPQLYPTIALSYGETAAFINISSLNELKETFVEYEKRISAVCLDMQKKVLEDSDEFYKYILEKGGGKSLPIIAVCREGDMEHLRQAVELDIQDVLTLPPHMDTIRRRIARAIAMYN